MLTPMLAMPAIYRFDFPESPEESAWGWHRVRELLETLNNIRMWQKKEPMTAQQMSLKYSYLNPRRDPEYALASFKPLKVVVENDRLWEVNSSNSMWFHVEFQGNDVFIPAKIGMRLIEAEKHPMVGALKRVASR